MRAFYCENGSDINILRVDQVIQFNYKCERCRRDRQPLVAFDNSSGEFGVTMLCAFCLCDLVIEINNL